MRKSLKTITTAAIMLVIATSAVSLTQIQHVKAIAAPTGVSISIDENKYTVRWNDVNGADYYNIYRAESKYANYTKIATNITDTSYIDTKETSGYYKVTSVDGNSESAQSTAISEEISLFGENVYIYETTDDNSRIQSEIDSIYKKQQTNQFGSERYAIMFQPGTYSTSLDVDTGFYTQVAGLGISPEDTSIGNVNAKAEWMISRKPDGDLNYNATCNFWRSAENLTLNITSETSRSMQSIWAVSQATSFRRMNVKGNLAIQQNGGYASGGFLADSQISGNVTAWSQQQWLTRNSSCRFWEGGVWNMNFVGMEPGSAPGGTWPNTPNTTISKTEEMKEKPFVSMKDGEYGVFVPADRKDAVGVSWKTKVEGEFISIDKFYIARPGDSAAKINEQLANGKNLIFTPGLYNISESIKVTRKDTIVLGLGYATLKPTGFNECITVSDVGGVVIADILIDAGNYNTESLMTVGTKDNNISHADNPILLANLYIRVGGADEKACKTKTCLIVNSNNVIGDNFWIWRADHGKGVSWDKNTCDTGVIVNGDNVTMYALMVEHFQKYQTIWNGNNGKTFMYQCEIPYDVPSQSAWMNGSEEGYSGYYVNPNVTQHQAYGMGVYANFTSSSSFLNKAITVPDKPGVKITNAISVVLSGKGGIDHVVNNAGSGVLSSGETCRLMSYCNGQAVAQSLNKKYITMASVSGIPSKKAYTGKKITFKNIKVTYRGITLRRGIDYYVTYKNNKDMGTATVKVKGKGMFKNINYVKFKIVPARPNLKAKAGKKKISLRISKVKGTKRYEVRYSTSKKFKKKTILKTNKRNITIKKLDSKKKYYVKVRAYKVKNKKQIFGRYSKTIKVRTK